MILRLLEYAPTIGPWNPPILFLSVGIFIVCVGAIHTRLLVFGSLACYSLLMIDRAVLPIPAIVDVRLVGVGMTIYLAMLRQRLPRFSHLRRGAFPATLLYVFFGLALSPWSINSGLTWEALSQTMFAVIFVWVLVGAADEDELRSAVWTVAFLITSVSLVYVLAGGASGIANGRWKGITTNANTLGLYTAILFTLARQRSRILTLPLVVTLLLGTASRASTFALGLVAGPRLLEGTSTWVRRTALALALIAAIPVVHSVFFSSADAAGSNTTPGLTRTKNSRADEWADGMRIVRENPATGVGAGNQPELVSSSVISPLTQLGLWALIPLGAVVAVAYRRIRSPESVFRPLFVLLCIHGIFEMWLFAGGSIFFVIFLIAAFDPGLRPGADDAALEQVDDLELAGIQR